VINNNTPTFDPAKNPDWAFDGGTSGSVSEVKSASGPHAFTCNAAESAESPSELYVSLFAASPFTLDFSDGSTASCSAPASP
jgi:hypothetical protein